LHILLSVLFLDIATEQLHLNGLKLGQLLLSLVIGIILNIVGHMLDQLMTSSMLQSLLLVLPIVASVYLSIDVAQALIKIALPPLYARRVKLSIPLPLSLLACFAVRTFSLGSSSIIEFEYKISYYLGNTLLLLIALKTLRRRITKANVELDGRHLHKIASACLWQQRKIFVVLILLTIMRYLHRLTSIKSTLMLFALLLFWARLRKFTDTPQAIFNGIAFVLVYSFRGLNGQVHFFALPQYMA